MLIVVLLRPQTVVIPPVITPEAQGGGCLTPLLLGLLLLGLLLFAGNPA